MEAVELWIVVPAAVGSAAGFGLAGALQHTTMAQEPTRGSMRLGLLRDLIGRPLWMASIGATIVASALQLLALSRGPVAMVQPLLVTGLLFALFFRSSFRRRMPPRWALLGAGLCVVGLAAFLAISRPPGGAATVAPGETLLMGVVLGAALLACLGIALWRPGQVRSLALALGGGLLYGTSATIAKVATGIFLDGGIVALLLSWPLYAMAVLGPGGFLMTQHAYRAHRYLAPAQAVITLTDPLISVTLGIVWLHERLRSSPLELAGQVLGLITVAAGVWLLAHHSASEAGANAENEPETASESQPETAPS